MSDETKPSKNKPERLNPGEVAWTDRLFSGLRIGGIWGVPRSGLIFKRTGEKEVTVILAAPFSELARAAGWTVRSNVDHIKP